MAWFSKRSGNQAVHGCRKQRKRRMSKRNSPDESERSVNVRGRLVEALKLDLFGPWAGHEAAEERIQGWGRASTWYLTGFLIPSGTPPEKSGDADADDDLGEAAES